MKKLKNILVVLAVVIFTLSIIVNARAEDGVSKSAAKYALQSEIDKTTYNFEELTKEIIGKNTSLSNLNSNNYGISFNIDTNKKFENTKTLDSLFLSEITEIESYYITPENSSSGDLVIMVDIRMVNEKDNEFIAIFEYHINSGNQVYGINTWIY